MKKLLFGLMGLMFLVFSVHPPAAKAQNSVNAFTINNFKADYVLDNDAVGGSLETTETITLTFLANNHGILRAIPMSYQGYSTKLEVQEIKRNGTAEQYDSYIENGNRVLRIGDPNRTITGQQTYTIRYTQERVINFSDTLEFYWDVNGTQWQQVFENVEATLRYKNGSLDGLTATCFTGRQGARERDCQINTTDGEIRYTATNLQPAETLTITAEVPAEFDKPGPIQVIGDYLGTILGLLGGLLVSAYAFLLWWRHGRDKRGRGVIVPEYGPPKDLSPGEIGLLVDFSVDNRDIIATIIDLAIRGYLRIYQEDKKILMLKSTKFTLELLRNDVAALQTHEQQLLKVLFPDMVIGVKLELNDVDKGAMQTAFANIKKDLRKALIETHGVIEKGGKRSVSMFVAAAVIGVVVIIWHPNAGTVIGGLLAVAALTFFGVFMQRRNSVGVAMYEKIQGLKLYMNTAEKDRLAMMQSVDRPYAEPSKTVELFEKLLPYAIVLGVEKSWANQFDSILSEPPNWYSGTADNTFLAGHIASGISGVTEGLSNSFSANTSSSSSSSSGFSGGGGGGGGGGGW